MFRYILLSADERKICIDSAWFIVPPAPDTIEGIRYKTQGPNALTVPWSIKQQWAFLGKWKSLPSSRPGNYQTHHPNPKRAKYGEGTWGKPQGAIQQERKPASNAQTVASLQKELKTRPMDPPSLE